MANSIRMHLRTNDICKYRTCYKVAMKRKGRPRGEFCGITHKDWFMAERFESLFEVSPQFNLQQCNLEGCAAPKRFDALTGDLFDFCRRSHFLKFVELSTRKWLQQNRLCQLKDCFHHVAVDEVGRKAYDYCSLKHATLAAAARGFAMGATSDLSIYALDGGLPSATGHNLKIVSTAGSSLSKQTCDIATSSNLEKISSDITSRRGYHEKMKMKKEDFQRALEEALTAPENTDIDQFSFDSFATGVDIMDFHPWELNTEHKGLKHRYFLNIATERNPRKITKEGFGWKQTSRPKCSTVAGNELQIRYFKYELKDKDPSLDRHGEHVRVYRENTVKASRWLLHEMEWLGAENPNNRTAVIWEIYQNENGGPVWPPVLPQDDVLKWLPDLPPLDESILDTAPGIVEV